MKKVLQLLTGRSSAYDAIRILNPSKRIDKELKERDISVTCIPCQQLSVELASQFDITIIHGCFSVSSVAYLRQIPFAIGIDDLITNIPMGNPVQPSDAQYLAFEWAIKNAASLICTTQALVDAFPGKQSFLTPNLVDLTKVKNTSERVAYVAGSSHNQDMELISSLYDTKRELIFWTSSLPHKFSHMYFNHVNQVVCEPNKPNIGWITQQEWPRYTIWMKNLEFGVGLAPLANNAFNRCKSVWKWLEYLQKGAITVASDIGPYSSLPDEVLVKIKPGDDWNDGVEYAFGHREEIYNKAFEYCENYTYDKNNSWVRMYEGI